ncbi:MAG: ribonuclease P protein component [Mycobacteriaceae bacterium]|nr:ribonuclease P protein component [Mycobacteriaceae bacterium]MBV9638032.1 ribonuclease P protein component [Mycobacteriaceae bacterium]
MLPAQNRMRRSVEFGATVKHGVRVVQPDIVVHAQRVEGDDGIPGPRIGLVVSKAVGSAVERHRVARQLRHVARAVVGELNPADRVVIRALPSSRRAIPARLEQQLRDGLNAARLLPRGQR